MKSLEVITHLSKSLKDFSYRCEDRRDYWLGSKAKQCIAELDNRASLTPKMPSPSRDSWVTTLWVEYKNELEGILMDITDGNEDVKTHYASELSRLVYGTLPVKEAFRPRGTLFAGLKTPDGAEEIDQVLKNQLQASREPDFQRECIAAMKFFAGEDTNELLVYYLDPKEKRSDVRRAAIYTLGHLGGEHSVEMLTDVLSNDPDEHVPRETLRALNGLILNSFWETK